MTSDELDQLRTAVAAISAVISLFALVVSGLAYLFARRNAAIARRPVLVFEWTKTKGWRIRNPGNGPALNIRVALRGPRVGWTESVIVPALASGADFDFSWVKGLNAWMLGAEYEDFLGARYTTICQHDMNLSISGFRLASFTAPEKNYLPKSALRHWNAKDLSNERSLEAE